MPEWMIYGANGYTGRLIARLAASRGQHPILAGRNGTAVAALAAELGLEHRAVVLDDPGALRDALSGLDVVAHCAGPFSATAAPVVDACLATGTHYLDVTGEIEVFEQVFARHDEAVAAGIVLLPGAGFDVVPTDCLAAALHDALPGATGLELAFRAGGGLSPGTARTSLEGMAAGGRVRRDGRLVPCPPGTPRRTVPLPSGPSRVAGIRWGDLATAYRSTGIPNITTYTVLPGGGRGAAMASAMARAPLRALAARAVPLVVRGPGTGRRGDTTSEVWGEVTDADGNRAEATLTGPNAYDMTADSVVRAIPLIGGVAAGAHTPSSAFGAGYAATLDRVEMSPVRV